MRLSPEQDREPRPGVPRYRLSPLTRAVARGAEVLDHRFGWDRLPLPVGLLALPGIRATLRETPSTATTETLLPPLRARVTRFANCGRVLERAG